MTATDPKTCSRCGAALESGDELCPRCLLALGRTPEAPAAPAAPNGEPASSARRAKKRAVPTLAEIARRFPELEVLALVGEGGMGVVYKARQAKIDRFVALKVLALDPSDDPTFAERFRREALVLARLDHPNVVKLYDFGERDGLFFLVLEFVDGANLRDLMKQGLVKPKLALAIVPQMCEALQFAHDEGVVHRDIKPENVLIDAKGRVKIADFGLAKLLDADAREVSLTEVGQVMGTPHYMAPEQLRGAHDVDHRADIYSLGVVFYEMLTGELPRGNFELPSKRFQVDVRLDEIVLKSLERTPERRYQHAIEVKTDVESVGNAPPRSHRDTLLGSLTERTVRAARAYAADHEARGRKMHGVTVIPGRPGVIVIPGRPWECFVFFLLLWPLAGLAFNSGAGWLSVTLVMIALIFWSLVTLEIKAQGGDAPPVSAGSSAARTLTAMGLLAIGFFALYSAHVTGFSSFSREYRSGPDDPDSLFALETRLLPVLESRLPLTWSLERKSIQFETEQIWPADRMKLWSPWGRALLAVLACAAAALVLSVRRGHSNAWRRWIPTVRSTASLFGSLFLVHGTCALVAMSQIEGGPLVNVLAHGTDATAADRSFETMSEHGTEELVARLRAALSGRQYAITASGVWRFRERGTAAPSQQMQILFADPESTFDRWHLTWSGPKRVLPHAVFLVRGPREEGACTLDCDLGDVPQAALQSWSEWFPTLLR